MQVRASAWLLDSRFRAMGASAATACRPGVGTTGAGLGCDVMATSRRRSDTSKLAMLPWWPRDYLGSTRAWSLAERGAFIDLLSFAWEAPLPDDAGRLARMLGVSTNEFYPIWETIGSKFKQTGEGTYINERLEHERRTSMAMRKAAHERAKSGGDATKAKWEAASLASSKATSLASSTAKPTPQATLQEGSPASSSASSSNSTPAPARVKAENREFTHANGQRN